MIATVHTSGKDSYHSTWIMAGTSWACLPSLQNRESFLTGTGQGRLVGRPLTTGPSAYLH